MADLLYLTFQVFLPSEPSARVEGLATIEAPVKNARTFVEALSFLRSWHQQVLTVANDLGGNPEPLKLLSTSLLSLLWSSQTARGRVAIQMPTTKTRVALPPLLPPRLPHLNNPGQRPRPRVIPRRRLAQNKG